MADHPSTLRVLALSALGFVAGCDGNEPPATVTFNGVTYEAIGDAQLDVQGSVLVVSNIGTTGRDGVRVAATDGQLDSLDVSIQPLTLGDGARWGLSVLADVGDQEVPLAVAWAEDIGAGTNAIQVSFAPGLGLDQVFFEYFLGGTLVARSPPVPTGDNLSATVASAGTTDVGPHSVHAVREGGVVVIGTDYRSEGLQGGGPSGLGCTAALIEVDFQPDPVCSDYVRAVPVSATGGTIPPAHSAEIDGRSIDRFIITDGAVL